MTSRIVIIGGGQAGGWAAKPCAMRASTAKFAWWRKKSGIYERRRCQKRLCWSRTRGSAV
ncbi:MAG: hypothetical protein ACLTXH_01695 [Enterobacter hormaechei]